MLDFSHIAHIQATENASYPFPWQILEAQVNLYSRALLVLSQSNLSIFYHLPIFHIFSVGPQSYVCFSFFHM